MELKKQYHGEIEVLLGIEADFLPEHLELYRSVIAAYPLDYVIGSVHEFAGIAISTDTRSCVPKRSRSC
ncbi:hypothetical protein [Paenibacillus cellulositrophicus]|uniref:hypothetical protein n=1 Tax=Paenibacillus cellulositrophicus TaxID=562959 RepID=UPI003D96C161